MLQLGRPHTFSYYLGPDESSWTTEEKDLGVWMKTDLKPSLHSQKIYRKSSCLLGMLGRLFGSLTPTSLPLVINTYIRPVMEYAVQAWAPWLEKDKHLLQRIYHRATKIVVGLQHTPYDERMRQLDLLGPDHRRIRADLILMFIILRTKDHPLKELFAPGSTCVTRQHSSSVAILSTHTNCR